MGISRDISNDINSQTRFAPKWDTSVRYMERTESWYLALGYNNPYEWAHFVSTPFSKLNKPLSNTRLTLITTAAPYQPDKGDQGPGSPYNASAKFYKVYSENTNSDPDVRISHLGIDRKNTTAEDINTYFPLKALKHFVDTGRIGSLTKHFHGLPTNRSQKHTMSVDCPEIVKRCIEDGAEAAILVPNCPICHQSISLAARYLEESGIPTVIMGAAKDIVEHVGVPRLCFSDFPLGNAAGKPNDIKSQHDTLELALKLLESAPSPRTTVQNPQRWSDNPKWHLDYCNVELFSENELKKIKNEVDEEKRIAKLVRESTFKK